ncbi:MAG: lipopolysaccharide heptosyltransferase I [Gammaproteobacteria bacterium]|nr:MAG: lipopolysaccharide heptosyltransferase I [Gammaproteobacteria bacterium]
MPRILLIKTSSLGDVVHNLPVASDIATRLPGAILDWVAEEAFADIPALHPSVSSVLPVATRRWRKTLGRAATWREMRRFRRRLQSHTYDVVLDTQGLVKSAVIARLARGVRCGQDKTSAREPLAARFYDRAYPVARGRHAVVRNRELAALAFGYAMPTTPPDYGLVLPAEPLPPELARDYVVCLHGTSRASKLWPPAHWVAFADALLQKGLTPLLPWGDNAERARAEAIHAACPGVRVLPRMSLRGLAVVLGHARAVVGVDTGLLHLAGALDRPVVGIYTGSDPQLTGVYPHDPARVANLGGFGQVPAVEEVLAALNRVSEK